MRLCGKRYGSQKAAKQSAAGLADGATAFECRDKTGCAGWHVRPASSSYGAMATRKPLLPGPTHRDPITPEVRALCLERDHYASVVSGLSIFGQRYSLAHRVRAAQGGKAVPSNLLTVLGWGGEGEHGRIDLFKDPEDGFPGRGYRLRSGTDPLLAPVWIFRPDGLSFWAWLDDGPEYKYEAPDGAV